MKRQRAIDDCFDLKNEIGDLELTIAKVEKEKHIFEIKIKNLKEEISGYEAVIEKIDSEKKNLQQLYETALDNIQAESDKV